ncbi:hypothetical protein LMG29542_08545 [Paraburkholderia humisilvae]|uniref:Uncharacterized protein n=1 Tax=Paraburkholderia humisilvae TaxID=627669 RepID=A0A6J5F9V8_9BURK|nr:hypothetical protein LMG29542_08545 [Paraburkholderia humisilvae]
MHQEPLDVRAVCLIQFFGQIFQQILVLLKIRRTPSFFYVASQPEPEGPVERSARVVLQAMMPDPLVDGLFKRDRTRTRNATHGHQLRPGLSLLFQMHQEPPDVRAVSPIQFLWQNLQQIDVCR